MQIGASLDSHLLGNNGRCVPRITPSDSRPQHEQKTHAKQHAGQPNETYLHVAHLQRALKHLTPDRGTDKGQDALDHQHEGAGHPQGVAHATPLFFGRACRGQSVAPHGAEKLATGVQHHHISFVAEAGPVRIEAPVELSKLRVFAKRRGVER